MTASISEPDPGTQAGLVEVQLALDLPQRLGRIGAIAAHALEVVAFGVDHLVEQARGHLDIAAAVFLLAVFGNSTNPAATGRIRLTV